MHHTSLPLAGLQESLFQAVCDGIQPELSIDPVWRSKLAQLHKRVYIRLCINLLVARRGSQLRDPSAVELSLRLHRLVTG